MYLFISGSDLLIRKPFWDGLLTGAMVVSRNVIHINLANLHLRLFFFHVCQSSVGTTVGWSMSQIYAFLRTKNREITEIA